LIECMDTLFSQYLIDDGGLHVGITNNKLKTFHIFEKNRPKNSNINEYNIKKTIVNVIKDMSKNNIYPYEKMLANLGEEIKGRKKEKFIFFREHLHSKYSIAATYLIFLKWISSESKIDKYDIEFIQKILERPFNALRKKKNYHPKVDLRALHEINTAMLENLNKIFPHQKEIWDVFIVAFFSKNIHKKLAIKEVDYEKGQEKEKTRQRCQIILDLFSLYPEKWMTDKAVDFLKDYIDSTKKSDADGFTYALPNTVGVRPKSWVDSPSFHLWSIDYLVTLEDMRKDIKFDQAKTSALLVRPYVKHSDGKDKYTFIPWIKFIKEYSKGPYPMIKALYEVIKSFEKMGITDTCTLN